MGWKTAIAAKLAPVAGPASAVWDAALVVVRVLGGWRATAFLCAALWFAWQSHLNGARADKLELEKATAAAAQAKAELALKEAQGKVTVRVEAHYVDRVQVVRGRTQTIVKEVPIYVPSDTPALPGGFRVLHDAAAAGELPDPTRIADAAPVEAQSATETIAENYGVCHENAERLTSLQEWVREQQKLAP